MIGQQQEGSTITQIMDMKKQGLSNNQIIQNMQRAGFTNSQIFDAMNQLETKNAVDNLVPMNQLTPQGNAPFPPGMGQSMPPPMQNNQMPPQNPAQQAVAKSDSTVKTEELIEAIIDEKWSDLINNVQKIVEWKNSQKYQRPPQHLALEPPNCRTEISVQVIIITLAAINTDI